MITADSRTDIRRPVSWFVGTCGISNPQWVGNFYPRGLRSIERLAYYAGHFNSIELNTTFHAIPERWKVQRWKDATPCNFRFCVKFPREVTHGRPESLLKTDTLRKASRFFDVVQELGEKLALVLLQFPPWFSSSHRSALLRFVDLVRGSTPLVLEFRNTNWWTPATEAALRERNIGWATADLTSHPEVAPRCDNGQVQSSGLRQLICTTDFVYVRMIGKHHQFRFHVEEYFDSTHRLTCWLDELTRILKGRTDVRRVYTFFDDDFSGHAPTSARRLANMVKLPRTFEAVSVQSNQLVLPFSLI